MNYNLTDFASIATGIMIYR